VILTEGFREKDGKSAHPINNSDQWKGEGSFLFIFTQAIVEIFIIFCFSTLFAKIT